ncbi:hypothetical protein HanIR_Chr17g0862761 [Helianthus annuus]|nr:hypothetical protein HanIR_Chr17g0862761 [Helianthus annuus]
MKLELGSVRAYLFELGSQVKPKARAILRTTSNKLKARLKLTSILLKRAKARLELCSPMLSSSSGPAQKFLIFSRPKAVSKIEALFVNEKNCYESIIH